MKRRVLIVLCLCLIMVLALPTLAYALTPSLTTTTAERNYIANDWSYYARGWYENNCLAYALDNTTDWIWPWGQNNPTLSQVESYMSSVGYPYMFERDFIGPYYPPAEVACYGWTNSIKHFAKVTSYGYGWYYSTIRAKWGHYEIFDGSNGDPYTNNVYGPEVAMFSPDY